MRWFGGLIEIVVCTFREDTAVREADQGVVGEVCASAFARDRLGFEADEKQRAVLDSTAKRGILNCTRQWGKTTVLAAKAVHRAWTRPGALVLAAGPGERQSRIFLRAAAEFLSEMGVPRRGDGDNGASLALPNGSRIVALPGTEATVRGFAGASMILIDEASRVSDSLYLALQPMLATSDGDLWLMSTPNGKSGFFWETWAYGEDWERHTATATECARIPAQWLERQRRDMVGNFFRQEYLCEFVEREDGWFTSEMVERMVLRDGQEL